MFIIIEGCTLTGKSTLRDEIVKQLLVDGRTIDQPHHGQPAELTRAWVLQQYAAQFETRCVTTDEDTIIADRWHYGERTYAPIYRASTNKDGYGLLGKAGWRWIEMFLQSRGAYVIAATAAISTLEQRLSERGDDHVTSVQALQRVRLAYTDVWHSGIGYYDSSYLTELGEPTDAVAARFIRNAEGKSARAATLRDFPEYIGVTRPRALLVIDERNTKASMAVSTLLPYAPLENSSGEYMLDALSPEFVRGVGIININKFPAGADGAQRLRKLMDVLGAPETVAVGKGAGTRLSEAALDFRRVPTPAQYKRDKEASPDKYRAMVEGGAK